MRKGISLIIFLLCFIPPCFAALYPTGIRLSYGEGNPNQLRGGRVALQWPWGAEWLEHYRWHLGGYWELSGAQWMTDGDENGRFKSVNVVAFAPVLRFQADPPYGVFQPYLEASVGGAYLSKTELANRELGGNVQFQDLFGVGAVFGQHWDLGIHYLHYSNGSFARSNDGIDVKWMLSLGYINF